MGKVEAWSCPSKVGQSLFLLGNLSCETSHEIRCLRQGISQKNGFDSMPALYTHYPCGWGTHQGCRTRIPVSTPGSMYLFNKNSFKLTNQEKPTRMSKSRWPDTLQSRERREISGFKVRHEIRLDELAEWWWLVTTVLEAGVGPPPPSPPTLHPCKNCHQLTQS